MTQTRAAPGYVGRFAPSPTGRLHLGSLVAALGSALDARAHHGRWHLRMEDLDTPRVIPGAADEILHTLEQLGFEWSGPVLYQSRRTARYAAAEQVLASRGLLFECSCSRSAGEPASGGRVYPGTCRNGPRRPGPTAKRFRVDPSQTERFIDRIRGECALPLASLGDVIVRRRDGIFAYQLAVVVDDAEQGVTDVVRGADLLESSAWQRALQRALGLPTVRYAHLPLVVESDGAKLAKSRHSVPLDPARAAAALFEALRLLGQQPPAELRQEPPGRIWTWAADHWSIAPLAGRSEVRI